MLRTGTATRTARATLAFGAGHESPPYSWRPRCRRTALLTSCLPSCLPGATVPYRLPAKCNASFHFRSFSRRSTLRGCRLPIGRVTTLGAPRQTADAPEPSRRLRQSTKPPRVWLQLFGERGWVENPLLRQGNVRRHCVCERLLIGRCRPSTRQESSSPASTP